MASIGDGVTRITPSENNPRSRGHKLGSRKSHTRRCKRSKGHIIERKRHNLRNEEASQLYDANFHMAIAHASNNSLLENMMENLSTAMARTIRDSRKLWLYSDMSTGMHLFQEHEQIYHSIKERDKTAAVIMKRHLERVKAALAHL